MAYTSKAVATETYKNLTPVELRGLHYDWQLGNKDRSILVNFFKVDPNKELKWWNDLVITIETDLGNIANDPDLKRMFRAEYDVVGYRGEQELTVFKYIDDFEGAKKWATEYYKSLTGHETNVFRLLDISEISQRFPEVTVLNISQKISVKIQRYEVEI